MRNSSKTLPWIGTKTYSWLIILILQSMLCIICILGEQIHVRSNHGNFF